MPVVNHKSRLGLGTVQFGLDYGISNLIGQTPIESVTDILDFASKNSITTLDTAHTYGDSEQVIGLTGDSKQFEVVTKTIPIFKKEVSSNDIKIVCNGVFESLKRLKLDQLDGLLVHHCDDLKKVGGGSLFRSLSDLKSQSLFLKMGVSVYSAEDIDFVLKNYDLDLIQIPMNVFDQRLLHSGALQRIKNSGIEVHVRSAFLQGVVFMDPKNLPHNLSKHSVHLTKFRRAIKALNVAPATACLAFLMQQPEIDKVICGVNSLSQLTGLIENVSRLPIIEKSFFDSLWVDDDSFLNPSNW